MKEARGIVLTDEEVGRLRRGAEQFRRLVRRAPINPGWGVRPYTGKPLARGKLPTHEWYLADGTTSPFTSPFGRPGDVLWVRECCDAHGAYRADGRRPKSHWIPSTAMPRELSRFSIKLLELRVERIHRITASDMLAEGYPVDREAYARNWSEITGFQSWAINPWTYALVFKVVRDDQRRIAVRS